MGADGTTYKSPEYCSFNQSNNLNGIACTYNALTDVNYFKNLPK